MNPPPYKSLNSTPVPEERTHPITIRVSTETLNEIDSRTPDRRRACREQYVMDALETYLGRPERAVYRLDKDGRYIS
jgi:hypothetical protein